MCADAIQWPHIYDDVVRCYTDTYICICDASRCVYRHLLPIPWQIFAKAKGPGTATTKKAKLTWLMGEIKDEDLSTIEVLPPRSCMTSHVTSSALHAAAS